MEKFTAAQARGLMPDCFGKMISQVHNAIREAATAGSFNTHVNFPYEPCYVVSIEQVKEFLKGEGYAVSVSEWETKNQIQFYVNWRY